MWWLSTVARAASFDVVCEPGGDDLIVVGVPPLELRCTAWSTDDGTFREVTWRFGDGTTEVGSTVTHVYPAIGRYPLSVEPLEAAEPSGTADTGAIAFDAPRKGQVTVCGPPKPRFRADPLGGLRYRLVNTTPPDPGCVSELRWDVFAGGGQDGAPVRTLHTWDPPLVVPAEGTWTVVLTVGGIGGTAASAVTLEADGRRGDPLGDAAYARPCSVAPNGFAGAVPLLLLVMRRRRG